MIEEQSLLPFEVKDRYLSEDYIISSSNEKPYHIINSWPNWGSGQYSHILYLYGERKSGKTHLGHMWCKKAQAIRLSPDEFLRYDISIGATLYIDDLSNEEVWWQDNQSKFFHQINEVIFSKLPLLIISRYKPTELMISLEDLRSRMISLPQVKIEPIDDELFISMAQKLFSDRQVKINKETIVFLSKRIPRSYSSLYHFIEKADQKSLVEKRKITIPLLLELVSVQGDS